MADVAEAMADRLAAIDPARATTYRSNVRTLVADLHALDADYQRELTGCRSTELVTSHAAFGYLAHRYGLEQHAIAGLSPDSEPSAAALADIIAVVREAKVGTIYTETLASPALAQTIARETGAATAVLDPVEGITDDSAGADYLEVMRGNLSVLTKGQGCR